MADDRRLGRGERDDPGYRKQARSLPRSLFAPIDVTYAVGNYGVGNRPQLVRSDAVWRTRRERRATYCVVSLSLHHLKHQADGGAAGPETGIRHTATRRMPEATLTNPSSGLTGFAKDSR